MIYFPPAKINLGLKILGKREDGFHEIQSLFLPINWCDVLEIIVVENGEWGKLNFTCSGIKIPEELQVIGFTDGMLSKHATPSLSTVSQHGESMGKRAAELVIQRIDEFANEKSPQPFNTEVIETELILRNSTK